MGQNAMAERPALAGQLWPNVQLFRCYGPVFDFLGRPISSDVRERNVNETGSRLNN